MIDIGSIASLAGSLKTAGDIAKAMIDLRDFQALQSKMIELNGEIMSAQGSALAAYATQTAMIQEIAKLKEKIAESEAWERQKERYQLTDHGGRTFSYALKAGMEQGEPPHEICAHCYQQGRKSILQFVHTNAYRQEAYDCPGCGKQYRLGHAHEIPQPTVRTTPYDRI